MIKSTVALLEKICSRSHPLVDLYSRPYMRVVQNEIGLARIAAADRVLNIGCGAIPFTAMLIARLTGARVVAVDRDPQAAPLAQACVRQAGLASLVRIVVSDGSRSAWAPHGFDVAVVALQAEPKAGILSSLLDSGQGPSRVVARVPREPFLDQYDPLPPDCPIAARAAQNMKTFEWSALIVA